VREAAIAPLKNTSPKRLEAVTAASAPITATTLRPLVTSSEEVSTCSSSASTKPSGMKTITASANSRGAQAQ
jgi:hypothetical protein